MNDVYEIIQSYNDYIQKLPEGCRVIAELLRANDLKNAKEGISDFSEGLIWIEQVISLLNKNGVEYTLDFTEISYFLEKINTELEQQKYLQIATIFEGEIANFFENLLPLPQLKQ